MTVRKIILLGVGGSCLMSTRFGRSIAGKTTESASRIVWGCAYSFWRNVLNTR